MAAERFSGFLGCGDSIRRGLSFHLVRRGVKAQTILSTRSWGSRPSLLPGFVTSVDGAHIIDDANQGAGRADHTLGDASEFAQDPLPLPGGPMTKT